MFRTYEGIENVRDLGGMMRRDGARVRENVLLRTGRLENATDADIARLQELGLCAVVDFRDRSEVLRAPDREVPGAAYVHLPALPDLGKHFKSPDDPTYTAEEVRDDFRRVYYYLATAPEAHTAYEAFFQKLLASEGRPVLWHCTQGKDRTGVAALLILSALGIDEESIVQEYLLTNQFTQPQLDAMAAAGEKPETLRILREVFLVCEENIRYYLHCLQTEYGSVTNYLELALGVGPAQIETLEKYYLE